MNGPMNNVYYGYILTQMRSFVNTLFPEKGKMQRQGRHPIKRYTKKEGF